MKIYEKPDVEIIKCEYVLRVNMDWSQEDNTPGGSWGGQGNTGTDDTP